MYVWECVCDDCGHEFEYIGDYPPLECEECLSDQIEKVFLGRSY